jgi:uncharacterized membrane protein
MPSGLNHVGMHDPSDQPWWKTRSGIVLCGLLLIAGFYLLTWHTAHVFGVLPYLLLLACLLMHLFMHTGMVAMAGAIRLRHRRGREAMGSVRHDP